MIISEIQIAISSVHFIVPDSYFFVVIGGKLNIKLCRDSNTLETKLERHISKMEDVNKNNDFVILNHIYNKDTYKKKTIYRYMS